MATGTQAQPLPVNSCCELWKKDRDQLSKALRILCPKLNEAEAEILRLKKVAALHHPEYEEERARVVAERESKRKELDIKENEVSDLKSEMFSLQQRYEQDLRDREEEAKLFENQVSEGKNEINRLKELLVKEKIPDYTGAKREKATKESKKAKAEKDNDIRAKLLQKRVSEGKKEIRQLKKLVDEEKRRADSESIIADSEKNKARDYLAQLETLRQEADQTKSKLVLLTSKFEKVRKKLEAEKQRRIKHRKHADSQVDVVKEQKKVAKKSLKKAEEENLNSESLSQQLVAARKEIEELQKQMEIQKNLQKQVDELLSSGKPVEASPVFPHEETDAGKSAIQILKKELKFERKRVKHAKHSAKLEKLRTDVLEEELGRLKLEIFHFSNCLNLLNKCNSSDGEGTDDVVKVNNCRIMQQLCTPSPVNLHCDNNHLNQSFKGAAVTDPLKRAHQSPILIPRSRRYSKSISGTDSRLEPLIGGSNKKGLQSSRINSTAASFSDGQVVASQGKGDFSGTTSEEISDDNLNVQQHNSNMSGKTSMKINANVDLVDEDNPGLSCGDVCGVVKKKSWRTLETIESIECLYSEERKLHSQIEEKLSLLRRSLGRKRNRPLEDEGASLTDRHGISYANDNGVYKKKKVSREKKSFMQNVGEPKQSKKMNASESKIYEDLITSGKASPPASNMMGIVSITVEKTCDPTFSVDEARFRLEEPASAYMKLLALDNSGYDNCHKMTVEVPLSPSLPEIDFQEGETISKDDAPLSPRLPEIQFQNCENISRGGDPIMLVDMMVSNEDSLCGTIQSAGPSGLSVRSSEFAVDFSPATRSLDELKSVSDFIPKYCIGFSKTKDRNSIARIFCATRECIAFCPSVALSEHMLLESLLTLKTREHLSIKEKVCVLLSFLVHNFPVAVSAKVGSFPDSNSFHFIDTFARHINSATVNDEVRSLLAELLDELLNLLQEFLADGRVLYSAVSSDMLDECDSRISINLDGSSVVLCNEVASADQLLAGSVVLASLCSAFDRIDFMCETSFDILHKHSHDTLVLLTIFHVFAYLAGDKFFSAPEYDLTMSVLKSIVKFLEDGHPVAAMKGGLDFHSLAKCPFSDGSASLEVVVGLLLERVQWVAQIGKMSPNLIGLVASTYPPGLDITEQRLRREDAQSVPGIVSDASTFLLTGEMHDSQPKAVDSGMLCQLCDVLSLLELVAGYMGWDETSSHIVSPLLMILDMPLVVDFSMAIVTVLGLLGSFGVKSGGFEDSVVKDLRQKLSAFLEQETTIRGGLPVQIATVSSLLRLLPFTFHEITKGNSLQKESLDFPIHVDLVCKWFSLLSDEQQAVSSRFLESSHGVSD